jgi:uncharacterized protein YkwD
MFRVLSLGLVVTALCGCAVNPSTSVFSSLNSRDDNAVPATAAHMQPPAPQQEASLGSAIGGWWDSVASSFGGADDAQPPSASAIKHSLDPVAAQKLVNAYRAEKGLKPLKLNPKLSEAARRHSEDLAKSDRISHFGSDGSDAWERVRKSGYGARMTAENVGTGQQSLDEVFHGWQKSKDHNANLLLKDADEMGVAMVYNPKSQFKTFWTMVVASPKSVN